MKRLRSCFAICVAVLLLAALPASASTTPPDPEIEALIVRVEHCDGVVFIRNGCEHTAAEAAVHLRRKLRAAHGRIHTAEQLIDHIGTRSSFSGLVYSVRLPGGRTMDSATWLYGLLRELRASHRATASPPSG